MKDSSRFYSSLGLLVVLNLLIKPLWIFAIDRQVQNTVGTAEYGHYFSLFNLSVVLGFLLDLGITTYYNRQLASGAEEFTAHAGNFLWLKAALVLLYITVMVTCALLTGVKRWDIVTGVILVQVLTMLFLFLRAMLTARQWFRTDAWLSVMDKALMILLCAGPLYFPAMAGPMHIDLFLLFQVCSTAAAVLVTFLILSRRGVHFRMEKMKTFLNRKLVNGALPFALVLLLMGAHQRLDGFLLERTYPGGAREAGIYAASYRLLDAANMVGILLASYSLPYLARLWSAGQDIKSVLFNIRHLLMVFSVSASVATAFLAPWIHGLLYTHSGPQEATVLQYCIPALTGYSLISVYGTLLTATGHIRAFCVLTLGALLLNIALNIWLIPVYGARGCCIAALVSQTGCGIASMIYVNRKLGVAFHFRSLFIYTFIAAVLTGIFFLFQQGSLSPYIQLSVAGAVVAGIVALSGLFRLDKWKTLLRQPEHLK